MPTPSRTDAVVREIESLSSPRNAVPTEDPAMFEITGVMNFSRLDMTLMPNQRASNGLVLTNAHRNLILGITTFGRGGRCRRSCYRTGGRHGAKRP